MKLFDRLFRRRAPKPPQGLPGYAPDGQYLSELPHKESAVFEDYLFGDFLAPGTHAILPEPFLEPKLTELYAEMDQSLSTVFENGRIDEYNADMFENRIDAARALAMRSIETQYANIPQVIQIAVSAREADLARLREGEAALTGQLAQLREQYAALAEKHEAVHGISVKGRNAS